MPEVFKKNFFIFLIIVLPVFLCGLLWPNPPEKAKIEHLYSFKTAEDLKIMKKEKEKIFDFIFGRGEKGEERLGRPQGVFSRDKITLVTDVLFACVHVFNERDSEYFRIKKAGDEILSLPVGVAADLNDKIYVSDSKLNKVFIFGLRGDYKGELGKGKFLRPTGIAVDNVLERVYVVDTLAGTVSAFNFYGTFLFKFDAKDQKNAALNHPTYIAVSKDSDIYLVDSLNFKVWMFSKDGKVKSSFGKMGRTPGSFSMPKGVALDSDQNIYVSDSAFDNVQIFNEGGKLLLFFGEAGNRDGEFWLPAGISIDEENKIYVSDSYNGRVQVFKYLK